MLLWVHELDTAGLTQEITATDNCILGSIRPHIYKHGAPGGSLKLELRDTNNKLIASSPLVTIASISSAAYFHGYIKFDLYAPLTAGKNYNIKLVGSGYTYAPGAYIGWCNDYDLRKYDAAYSPSDAQYGALDMEVWKYKKILKGEA